MYVWSLTLVILLVGCMPNNYKQLCEIAQMKVDIYEACYDKSGCHLNSDDKYYLVKAKTDVIRYCVNEGHL